MGAGGVQEGRKRDFSGCQEVSLTMKLSFLLSKACSQQIFSILPPIAEIIIQITSSTTEPREIHWAFELGSCDKPVSR